MPSEEVCEVCNEDLNAHDECSNYKCYACGSLVFCDHCCVEEDEDNKEEEDND